MAHWLAMDIGGANLKAADGLGYSQSCYFPLWTEYRSLPQQIRAMLAEAPPADHLVITMTGELADCFEHKTAGVNFILEAVKKGSDNRHTRVYLTDGRMVTPQIALTLPKLAAASNWHALATFAGRLAPKGLALLVDIGSTTCDIIPLMDGKVATLSLTDTQRLLAGELVYTGVERSPICALVQAVPYRGQTCPVAQELFATSRDVYTLLDSLAEDANNTQSADGRPMTKALARVRMGRMIAADQEEFNHKDAVIIAEHVSSVQIALIAASIQKVVAAMPLPPKSIIISGHGEFLAAQALEQAKAKASQISLRSELGAAVSRVGPAYALAVLAREAAGL